MGDYRLKAVLNEIEKEMDALYPHLPDGNDLIEGKNIPQEQMSIAYTYRELEILYDRVKRIMSNVNDFQIGDRIRVKGTNTKGDVITRIYKSDGEWYFEFEKSDDIPIDSHVWEIVYQAEEKSDDQDKLEKEIDSIWEEYHGFESLSDNDVNEIIKHIAKFQRKNTVDEICEWLKEYCVPILSDVCVADLIDDLKERFE